MMVGFGTIINCLGILIGGALGLFFHKAIKEQYADMLRKSCGISVLFIGIAGAMEYMLKIANNKLLSTKLLLLTISLVLGGFLGEIIGIDEGFEKFGVWLKRKTKSDKDSNFINGFVNASLTVSIGAMGILGAISDGIKGDWSILATKSILDFVIVLVMSSSLGRGCIFSVIPVFIIEGGVTLVSKLIYPYMFEEAMQNISMVGSVIIFCIGLNLLFGKKINVANFLPSLVISYIAALIPLRI